MVLAIIVPAGTFTSSKSTLQRIVITSIQDVPLLDDTWNAWPYVDRSRIASPHVDSVCPNTHSDKISHLGRYRSGALDNPDITQCCGGCINLGGRRRIVFEVKFLPFCLGSHRNRTACGNNTRNRPY